MFFRQERKRVSLSFKGEKKLTQPYHKDECDLNKIFKRFRNINEVINAYDSSGAMYGDFSVVTDFRSAIERVRDAEDVFARFPAQVREQFGSVAGFLDAFGDVNKHEILRELGFLRQSSSQEMQQEAKQDTATE